MNDGLTSSSSGDQRAPQVGSASVSAVTADRVVDRRLVAAAQGAHRRADDRAVGLERLARGGEHELGVGGRGRGHAPRVQNAVAPATSPDEQRLHGVEADRDASRTVRGVAAVAGDDRVAGRRRRWAGR